MRMTVHDDAYACMRVTVVSNASPTDRPRDDRGAGVPRVRQAVGPNPPLPVVVIPDAPAAILAEVEEALGSPPSTRAGHPPSRARTHEHLLPEHHQRSLNPSQKRERVRREGRGGVCRAPPGARVDSPSPSCAALCCAVLHRRALAPSSPSSRARSVGRSGESRCVRAVLDE